jgi:hypothetical protein
MRLTLIHPAIGHRVGERPDRSDYIRTWQMEPLPIAALAAQTPKDVAITFYDDRSSLSGSTRRRTSLPSRSRRIPPVAPTRLPASSGGGGFPS